MANLCQLILGIPIVLVDIAIFICVCVICSISSKNPFKKIRIGDITNYYKNEPIANITENILYNNTIEHNNDYNEGENIIKLYSNLYSRNKSRNLKFLRKLTADSFCSDMHDSLVKNRGRSFEYIFDLNYGPIRGLSIAILVVNLSSIGLLFALGCCGKTMRIIMAIIVILAWIAKWILFILLFKNVENGDISKYDEFLDCPGVRVSFFEKKFSDIEKLRKTFLAFTVLNLLSEIFDKVRSLFEPCDKEETSNNFYTYRTKYS